MEDWIARGIGAAGVLIGLASLGLTAYHWFRSGPTLRVGAFVRPESGTLRVEVTSTGRLPATVRLIEIRDVFVLKTQQGTETVPTSRWTVPIHPTRELPVTLVPTDYIEADTDLSVVLANSGNAREVTVAAWAERGDGRWYSSKPIRLR